MRDTLGALVVVLGLVVLFVGLFREWRGPVLERAGRRTGAVTLIAAGFALIVMGAVVIA